MKKKSFLDKFGGLFSSTAQLQRIVILSGVVLVLGALSFGGYYYFDRYYQPQEKIIDTAVGAAEQAVKDDPNNIDKRIVLAENYLAVRRYDDALGIATPLITEAPDNQRLWLVLGITNYYKGTPLEGIPFLEKFVEAYATAEMAAFNKSFMSASYYLGESYLVTDQAEMAVPVLERSYGMNGSDADTMYKLGVAYTRVQKYNEAKAILHQATLFVPDFKEVYQQLAIVFTETGDAALADYANGMVAYCDKDYQTALSLLRSSEAAKSDAAPTYNGLGMVYEALVDLPAAQDSYEKALALDPNYLSSINGLERVKLILK